MLPHSRQICPLIYKSAFALHYIVRNTRSMTTSKYFMSGEAVVDRIAHAAYLIFQILFFASFVSTAYPFVFHIIVPHTDFQRSKISVSHF